MLLPPMVMPLGVASEKPLACELQGDPGVSALPLEVTAFRPIGAPEVEVVTTPGVEASSVGSSGRRGVKMPLTRGVSTVVSSDGGRLAPEQALTAGYVTCA